MDEQEEEDQDSSTSSYLSTESCNDSDSDSDSKGIDQEELVHYAIGGNNTKRRTKGNVSPHFSREYENRFSQEQIDEYNNFDFDKHVAAKEDPGAVPNNLIAYELSERRMEKIAEDARKKRYEELERWEAEQARMWEERADRRRREEDARTRKTGGGKVQKNKMKKEKMKKVET